MAKQILGDYDLPEEGDIIDQVAHKLDKNKEKVKQLKEKTDFLTLLASFGIEVKKNGKGHMAKCPFHADKNPSLSIEPDKKLFHCFGCGAKGDVIEFVKLYKQTDFKGAIEILKGNTGKPVKQVEKKKTLEILFTEEDELEKINLVKKVTSEYHKQLLKSKKALGYLETRGLKDFELIKRFTIGFCDGTTLLPKLSEKQKDLLKQAGIITARGKEHFAGCIVFPVIPEHGNMGEIYGRSITGRNPKHRYLKGKHEGIFHRKASKVYDEIILTECIIDALSLIRLGIVNVQSIYGTNGFTEEHLKTLKDDRVKTIVLALDNDDAGKTASEELMEKLVREGFGVKKIVPPVVKDWNDYLVGGGTAEEVKKLIAAAEEMKNKEETSDFQVKKEGQKYIFIIGKINYRILGVKKVFVTNLRVNIRAEYEDKRFPDNVDLCSARSRSTYSQILARMFELEVQRIENDLLKIMDYLEEERDRTLKEFSEEKIELTEENRKLGMELLESPGLFERIITDLDTLGYVGEELNKLLIYIAASSRKLDDPISVLILSQSASGKSLLVETIRKLIPPEDVVAISSLSDQALNYISPGGLLHKFLILGEAVHSDVVEHQIREMLSNHELSRMVTMKDDKSGQLMSQTIRTEVIVSAILSSTKHEINPENASRCFVINADESRNQTRRIHRLQKKKYSIARIMNKKTKIPHIIRQHHAAQRLLKKRIIVNPFAQYLDFPDMLMRTRRDHERFMDLIANVCFLRQYQKEEKELTDSETGKKITYIECDLTDYQIAYNIITGILPATLMNIPKGAVMLYEELRQMARVIAKEAKVKPEEVRFSQRDIREYTSHNQMFVKRYIRILVEYEFIKNVTGIYRGGRQNYQLVRDEDIKLFDLSMIPTVEELKDKLEGLF